MSSYSVPVQEWVRSARIVTGAEVWESFDPPEMDTTPAPKENFGDSESAFDGVAPEQSSADSEAEQIVRPVDIEAIEREAYQRGLEDGRRIGFEEGTKEQEAQLASRIELLSNLISALQQEKENFYRENELYIVKLAIEIARKILTREMTQSPELMLYIVREALKKITHNGRIVIRAHPEDIKLLKEDRAVAHNYLLVFDQVDFFPDEEMPRGGCLIESESGIVDARLDVQLEQIERSLLEGSDA